MGIFTRLGLTVASAGANSGPQISSTAAGLHPMLPRWGYAAAVVIGLSALLVVPPDRDTDEVARLERLVPAIERAQALAPETRESINRLVARQSTLVGTGGQSHEIRRKAAIERVTSAIRAREDSSTGRGIADAARQ
jgi:hypothetical protein